MSYDVTDQTRRRVRSLAGIGVEPAQIAVVLDFPVEDLTGLYARDLELGPVEAEAKIASALYAKALTGDVAAIDAWLKTRPGYF